MKKLNLISLLVILLFMNSGCAYIKGKKAIIKNRDFAYLASKESKQLLVPASMQFVEFGNDMVIPPGSYHPRKAPALTPPDSLADQLLQRKINKQEVDRYNSFADKKDKTSTVDARQLSDYQPELPNRSVDDVWSMLNASLQKKRYQTLHTNTASKNYFIADLSVTANKMSKEAPIYRLHLETTENFGCLITLSDSEGDTVDSEISQRILADIHDIMSKPNGSKPWWARFRR